MEVSTKEAFKEAVQNKEAEIILIGEAKDLYLKARKLKKIGKIGLAAIAAAVAAA